MSKDLKLKKYQAYRLLPDITFILLIIIGLFPSLLSNSTSFAFSRFSAEEKRSFEAALSSPRISSTFMRLSQCDVLLSSCEAGFRAFKCALKYSIISGVIHQQSSYQSHYHAEHRFCLLTLGFISLLLSHPERLFRFSQRFLRVYFIWIMELKNKNFHTTTKNIGLFLFYTKFVTLFVNSPRFKLFVYIILNCFFQFFPQSFIVFFGLSNIIQLYWNQSGKRIKKRSLNRLILFQKPASKRYVILITLLSFMQTEASSETTEVMPRKGKQIDYKKSKEKTNFFNAGK